MSAIMKAAEVGSALEMARHIVSKSPYSAVETLHAVRQLAVLAPVDLKPTARRAERAVMKTLTRGAAHHALALYVLAQFVAEMDRLSDVGSQGAAPSEPGGHPRPVTDLHGQP